MHETVRELIERNSRKPMSELMKSSAHLSFNEEDYGRSYCENSCPYRNAEYRWDCGGDCRDCESCVKDGLKMIYGADMLIEAVMNEGYQTLGITGIDKPFRSESGRRYADLYWDDTYNGNEGICADCKYYGSEKCPEDILSEECLRHGDVWAVEHIAEAVSQYLTAKAGGL